MPLHNYHRSSTVGEQPAARLPRTLPGSSALPIVEPAGHTMRFVADPIRYARRLFNRYGQVVALSHGGGTRLVSPLPGCPGTVLAYGPDTIRAATTQNEIYYKHPISGSLYPLDQTTAYQAMDDRFSGTDLHTSPVIADVRLRRSLFRMYPHLVPACGVGPACAIAVAAASRWKTLTTSAGVQRTPSSVG